MPRGIAVVVPLLTAIYALGCAGPARAGDEGAGVYRSCAVHAHLSATWGAHTDSGPLRVPGESKSPHLGFRAGCDAWLGDAPVFVTSGVAFDRRVLVRGADAAHPVPYRSHDEARINALAVPMLLSYRHSTGRTVSFIRAGCEASILLGGEEQRTVNRGGSKQSVKWSLAGLAGDVDVPLVIEAGQCRALGRRSLDIALAFRQGVGGLSWQESSRMEGVKLGRSGPRLWGFGLSVGTSIL